MPLQLTGAPSDPDLIRLPWDVPLEEWPAHHLVSLPRGISRHVVRFARLSGKVYAIKEISEYYAKREYRLLWDLSRMDTPSVEPVAVVTGRTDANGEPLDSALITQHLQFSLPYRAVMSGTLRPETLNRLMDALAVLLVRLHLSGFYWGDCSLSNIAVPPGRGLLRRLSGRRRDRRAPPHDQRGPAAVRHRGRAHQHLRRDARPGGGRAARTPPSTRRRSPTRSASATTGSGASSPPTRSSRRSTGT